MIPYLMNKSGQFAPLTQDDVGKSRKYWVKTDPWDIEINGSPQILKFD